MGGRKGEREGRRGEGGKEGWEGGGGKEGCMEGNFIYQSYTNISVAHGDDKSHGCQQRATQLIMLVHTLIR